MRRFVLNPGVILAVVLYFTGLAALSHRQDFEVADAMIELAFFGLLLPVMAWATTRRCPAPVITAQRRGCEVLLVLGLIIFVAVYLISGPQAIDALLPAAWTSSPRIHVFVNLGKKLIVFVLLPWALFRVAFGYRWRDF
ncbi:MAG TPA: hypothetical protein VGG94_01870, partial [Chthoniobacterales bacterium]